MTKESTELILLMNWWVLELTLSPVLRLREMEGLFSLLERSLHHPEILYKWITELEEYLIKEEGIILSMIPNTMDMGIII